MIVVLWIIGIVAYTVSIAARTERVGWPALIVGTVTCAMAVVLTVTS